MGEAGTLVLSSWAPEAYAVLVLEIDRTHMPAYKPVTLRRATGSLETAAGMWNKKLRVFRHAPGSSGAQAFAFTPYAVNESEVPLCF